MALQSAPGSVFVLANSAPSAFRGSALAAAATGGLATAALADASAPSSVSFVGLAAVGATLAAAASTRRRGQKVAEKSGRAAVVARRAETIAATAIANGNFTILVKALQKAGLVVLMPPAAPFDPARQVGAGAPLGYFDPLGFSKLGNKIGFNNLQSSEIKHGRVAMMAALGAVVQHYVKFPGFENVPSGLGAVTTAPGTYGFAALFLVSGFLELAVWTEDDKKEPGNFGDPAGFNMYNPEMRNKEINNGRMAMFSAIGIIQAEMMSGKDGMNQLGF
ncbi:unnamed protein product [Polarella glacialis]|uniref:Uncharacterized protein n=1 Tax=Polarella glacialis TaxID=89957 RepID=A0A813FDN2_POLGL|nr:unnamed protein product [Polarella glacialis]